MVEILITLGGAYLAGVWLTFCALESSGAPRLFWLAVFLWPVFWPAVGVAIALFWLYRWAWDE